MGPLEGSFEVNPPFVDEIMDKAVQHCNGCLASASRSNKALSFCMVFPHWPEASSCEHLHNSKWKTASLAIPSSSHGFCDGAQHMRRERHRISPYDTDVVFLQTTAAEKRWQPTKSVMSELFEA